MDDKVDKLDIYSYLKEKIDKYMLPNWIIYVDKFPYTESNKIDRKRLPKPKFYDSILSLQENITKNVYNNNNTINDIKKIILDASDITIDDINRSFNNYGIDSLEGVIINKLIGKTYNLSFSDMNSVIQKYDTLNKLSNYIDNYNQPNTNNSKKEDNEIYKYVRNVNNSNILFVIFMGINNGCGSFDYINDIKEVGADCLAIYHPNYTNISSYQDLKYAKVLDDYCKRYSHNIFIGNSSGCEGVLFYSNLCDIGVASGAPLYKDPVVLNRAISRIESGSDIRLYYGNTVDYNAIKRYPKANIYKNPNYTSNSHGIFGIKMSYVPFLNNLLTDVTGANTKEKELLEKELLEKELLKQELLKVGVLFELNNYYKEQIECMGFECYICQDRYDYDVILAKSTDTLCKDVLCKYDKLKLICLCGAGKDRIDTVYCDKNNITIRNIDDHEPVVEYILGMMIYELRNLGSDGMYAKSLYHSNIGLIGYGNIGKNLDNIVKVLGANTLIYSKSIRDNTLEYIFENSDIVVISVPLTDYTRGLISCKQLERLKENAIVISVGRKEIFNLEDLEKYVQNSRVKVIMDIYDSNNMEMFKKFDNMILTNHIAAKTVDFYDTFLSRMIDNLSMELGEKN